MERTVRTGPSRPGEQIAARIRAARESLAQLHIDWYDYDSLANVAHLEQLLSGTDKDLQHLTGTRPVLDIGCADGDFAFFLESEGARVTSVDHPRYNKNGMTGVRALKQALGSSVELLEIDLDKQFDLGSRQFGTAFALGVLYHLKNPFHFLETLARYTKWAFVSTRVTRFLADDRTDVSAHPVAYLLHEEELNRDSSNYWIFSEAGLKRLFERTQWRVLAHLTLGAVGTSNPHTLERDERAFCLLESIYGLGHLELLEGWYEAEDAGWRWTAPEFAFRVPGTASSVCMRLYVPDVLLSSTGELRLWCGVGGIEIGRTALRSSGLHSFAVQLPAGRDHVVTCGVEPGLRTGRDLGVVVENIDAR